MAVPAKLPKLNEMDFDKLVFTIGETRASKGRIVYVKNANGTDANFQCGAWTPALASADPDVRNAAIADLPHVRSHFHQRREQIDKESGALRIADNQTIEIQLSPEEIDALDRLHARYVQFVFENQDKLWPRKDPAKEKLVDIDVISERVGRLAKVNNDGTGRAYMHIKVHYPIQADGKPNPRAKHTILLQHPEKLTEMYKSEIESIQRNQPCVLTGVLRGMCVIASKLVHPTADLLMFGGCAFDPNAGARDPGMFTSFGMTIGKAPAASQVDTASLIGDDASTIEPMDVISNSF